MFGTSVAKAMEVKKLNEGENLSLSFADGDGVLEVRGGGSVFGNDGPVII